MTVRYFGSSGEMVKLVPFEARVDVIFPLWSQSKGVLVRYEVTLSECCEYLSSPARKGGGGGGSGIPIYPIFSLKIPVYLKTVKRVILNTYNYDESEY